MFIMRLEKNPAFVSVNFVFIMIRADIDTRVKIQHNDSYYYLYISSTSHHTHKLLPAGHQPNESSNFRHEICDMHISP